METSNTLVFFFKDDGVIPNNPNLPVLHYIGPFKQHPEQIRHTFHKNNWSNSWVNGVFDYHHYHSNCHEVLGIMYGSATLLIGGNLGQEVKVHAGDVIVLPAGTGHKRLNASADFQVVGAYPGGMSYDLKTGRPDELPHVLNDIQKVPLPELDPVYGTHGPLVDEWKMDGG